MGTFLVTIKRLQPGASGNILSTRVDFSQSAFSHLARMGARFLSQMSILRVKRTK